MFCRVFLLMPLFFAYQAVGEYPRGESLVMPEDVERCCDADGQMRPGCRAASWDFEADTPITRATLDVALPLLAVMFAAQLGAYMWLYRRGSLGKGVWAVGAHLFMLPDLTAPWRLQYYVMRFTEMALMALPITCKYSGSCELHVLHKRRDLWRRPSDARSLRRPYVPSAA